jgi:hypothetical protein
MARTAVAVKRITVENLPLQEQIQRRAYALYVQRGNQSGSEIDDWLQAEEEILLANEQAKNDRENRLRGY